MGFASDMAKGMKALQERKKRNAENQERRFFFTALPVDLEEDVDPSSPFQGFKLVPGIHIPKDYKENLAKQKDEKYQELLKEWLHEKDPERKKQIGRTTKEYWAVRRKELGFLDEEEIKRREEERKKKEEEERKQREIARQQHLLEVQEIIAKGIPAKHIVHCEYPGLEFRIEIDASEIDASYEDDYDYYNDVLSDYVSDGISNWLSDQGLDFEKFVDMDGYFTKDEVRASGHFWFGEIRTELFGDSDLPINEDIKIYLDDVRKDGTVIDTRELAIEDCFDLESQQEFLMECGFFDATSEYISISLTRFIEESTWNVALRKEEVFIEDVKEWPAPQKDGSWIDEDGTEMEPFIWFGDGYPDTYNALWNIHPEMAEYYLGFWFSEEPWRYIVEYDYSGHAGCYGGIDPDLTPIRESCPILLEKEDTIDTITAKIRTFFLDYYKKAHTSKK